MKYKSDAQVKRHLAMHSPKDHKSMSHEKQESVGFEKAEHRLGGKAKFGNKKPFMGKRGK